MILVMAHRVLADWFLTGAFLLFIVALVGAIVWSERDRRRAVRPSRERGRVA